MATGTVTWFSDHSAIAGETRHAELERISLGAAARLERARAG